MTLLIQKFDNFVVPLNHCYCYASDQGSNAKHKLSNNKYSYYCLKRRMRLDGKNNHKRKLKIAEVINQ